MKSLVLAEKPSAAREIARVLGCRDKKKSWMEGPRHVVTWALGHLVELAEPEDYDGRYKTWKLEDLPILPESMELKPIRETSHQLRAIRELAGRKDIAELVIATDAGREGELVARWIMSLIKWRKPFKRLWISSLTDKAIKEGFASLRPGEQYDSLFRSAVCRAEADWLIGLNVTRALTSKYNAQLAAGRVQTPTLGMVMEREQEIKRFRSVDYWTLSGDFGGFRGSWRSATRPDGRLFELEEAERIRSKVQGKNGKVSGIKSSNKAEPHPLAYDLTELQRDANKRLGWSAKQTSNVLQRLYEQHKLVTYPRTDSRYLTSDMADTLKERLEQIAVGPYAALARPLLRGSLPITRRIVDDSKVTDHHAIIPTEERVNLSALSADERKLYDLIVRRYISLFYPAFQYEETALTLEVAGETFHAKGRVIKQTGWKEVYGGNDRGSDEDEDEDEDADREEDRQTGLQPLPPLRQGASVDLARCVVDKRMTQPPRRYTEAGILKKMEQHNLGTPATRADIIEKLLGTDTIERQGTRLHPTGKGLQLIDLVTGELKSPDLTAQWEKELENIARGRGNAAAFMDGIRKQTVEMVRGIKFSEAEYKPHNLTHSRCPECGEQLQEIKGKRGKSLVCISRECSYRRSAEKALMNKRCPQCRKKMEFREGKAGKYAHCRPCNVIEMLDEQGGGGRGDVRDQKRAARQLMDKYSSDEGGFGASLGDALKAAMEKKDS